MNLCNLSDKCYMPYPHVTVAASDKCYLCNEILCETVTDALLPRVVAFVEEFPEYLQTIAHCARKSDVAVWQYFFSVVGNPIDLFQVIEKCCVCAYVYSLFIVTVV